MPEKIEIQIKFAAPIKLLPGDIIAIEADAIRGEQSHVIHEAVDQLRNTFGLHREFNYSAIYDAIVVTIIQQTVMNNITIVPPHEHVRT